MPRPARQAQERQTQGRQTTAEARRRPEEERRAAPPADGMAVSLPTLSLERFAKLGSFCRIISFCQSGCCATLYSQVYSRFGAALGRPCAIERFPAPVQSTPCALTGSAPPSPLSVSAISPVMLSLCWGGRGRVCIIMAPGHAPLGHGHRLGGLHPPAADLANGAAQPVETGIGLAG